MGYRVEYGKEDIFAARNAIRISRILLMTIGIAWGVCLLTYRFWPQGATVLDRLRSFHGVGEMKACLEILAGDIRSGVGLKQAIAAFCADVIQTGMNYAA